MGGGQGEKDITRGGVKKEERFSREVGEGAAAVGVLRGLAKKVVDVGGADVAPPLLLPLPRTFRLLLPHPDSEPSVPLFPSPVARRQEGTESFPICRSGDKKAVPAASAVSHLAVGLRLDLNRMTRSETDSFISVFGSIA